MVRQLQIGDQGANEVTLANQRFTGFNVAAQTVTWKRSAGLTWRQGEARKI